MPGSYNHQGISSTAPESKKYSHTPDYHNYNVSRQNNYQNTSVSNNKYSTDNYDRDKGSSLASKNYQNFGYNDYSSGSKQDYYNSKSNNRIPAN